MNTNVSLGQRLGIVKFVVGQVYIGCGLLCYYGACKIMDNGVTWSNALTIVFGLYMGIMAMPFYRKRKEEIIKAYKERK